jgi:hypothetical protein
MVQYDASNPRHIRKAEKRARSIEASSALYLHATMATVEGRAWFYALLERCHVFHQPFNLNALQTAFNCGEMNIGQIILAEIMVICPDQYLFMLREHTDGRTSTSDDRHSGHSPDARGPDNNLAGNGSRVVSEYEPTLFDREDSADRDEA